MQGSVSSLQNKDRSVIAMADIDVHLTPLLGGKWCSTPETYVGYHPRPNIGIYTGPWM